ncbi:MAG: Cytochrome c family protein [Labilithrix sp.]|nr:Cytochrome c family protein [Labilithrix sp.]
MRFVLPLVALVAALTGCHGASTASADSGAAPPSNGAAASASASATISAAPAAPEAGPEVAARGKVLYDRYCAFCHGDSGQGYKADNAPALANEVLLGTATDEYLRDTIAKGRPGTTMSGWSLGRGGPLGANEGSAIVSYLRTWQKKPSEAPEPRTAGRADKGAAVYAKAGCAGCHGAKGQGGKYNALGNPELLASASDAFLATTIERGRPGTPMPAFGAKLSKQDVDDVLGLLRSWAAPGTEPLALPPKAGELRSIVLNPKGPDAKLDPKASFVPVDAVKAEYDRGASMILVDARPPGDYARMHVAGAISIPFYAVADFAKQLPTDKYIIAYCGCPHAESGQVRDALRKLDYPRVAVLDEGLFAWRDRGYPVRGGAKP